MDVSMDDIRNAFDSVQQGRKTREEVSGWAVCLMKAEDMGELNYIPFDQETQIWDAIVWLIGIDLKNESGAYFHSKASIQEYRASQELN